MTMTREATSLQRQVEEAVLLIEEDLSDRALNLRAISGQKEQMEAIERDEHEKFVALAKEKEEIVSALGDADDNDVANDLVQKVEHLNRTRRLCMRAEKAKALAGVHPTVLSVM